MRDHTDINTFFLLLFGGADQGHWRCAADDCSEQAASSEG